MSTTTTRSLSPVNSSINTTNTLPSSTSSRSRFRCLHTRMLHEQCGHVSTLTIHEAPCTRSYLGWILLPFGSSAAPMEPLRIRCHEMEFHIAIEKGKCKTCTPPPVAPKTWSDIFGWRREVKVETPAAKREREKTFVSTADIVRRRNEWVEVIEKRKVEKEMKKLQAMMEREGALEQVENQ